MSATLDSVTGLSSAATYTLAQAHQGGDTLKIHLLGHCMPGSDNLYSLHHNYKTHFIFIANCLYPALICGSRTAPKPTFSLDACSAAARTDFSNSFAQKLHYQLHKMGIPSTLTARNKTVLHTGTGSKVTLSKAHLESWSFSEPLSINLYHSL